MGHLLRGPDEQLGSQLERAVLQTLSTVPARGAPVALPHHKSPLEIRRDQARAFIEKCYACPDLSITTIAAHLNVSRWYLQMVFKGDCTTPSEYLRSCRLAAAARSRARLPYDHRDRLRLRFQQLAPLSQRIQGGR